MVKFYFTLKLLFRCILTISVIPGFDGQDGQGLQLIFSIIRATLSKKDPKPFPFDRISELISLYIFFRIPRMTKMSKYI